MTGDVRRNTNIDLFTPIRMGAIDLSNRMVMAPMTRNRAGKNNVVQDMTATYYAQRAGAGLIVTEATQISPQGVGYPATPGIHSEAQITAWHKVTNAVHAKNGHIYLQLWHVGRISHPSLQPNNAQPVAPSAIKPQGQAVTYEGMKPFETPRALEVEEIDQIVGQYAAAAKNAMRAGFDGVEIHAANGYLIDQFIRDGSNQRDDKYGGSIENRCRFLFEVTAAVTEAIGGERVGVRLSPAGGFNDMRDSNPAATFTYAVEQLNRYALAYIHVIEAVESVDEFDFFALRSHFKGLYIANTGYDFAQATEVIKNGSADLVSFGQLFLANPDLPARFAQGTSLNTPDQATYYGGDEKGYIDYPALQLTTV